MSYVKYFYKKLICISAGRLPPPRTVFLLNKRAERRHLLMEVCCMSVCAHFPSHSCMIYLRYTVQGKVFQWASTNG